MFALGIALISMVRNYTADLTHFLFGDVLGVSVSDLVLITSFGLLILLVIVAFYKEFLVVSFDPVLAATLRLPIRLLDYLLIGLIAMSIVVSLQTVGVTMMVAMLVTPAAAASLLTRRLSRMMIIASLIAIFSGVTGIYLSYYLNLASGAAIVLTCTAVFAVIWAVRSLARKKEPAAAHK
jgi:manganese/iron transport system permease protein